MDHQESEKPKISFNMLCVFYADNLPAMLSNLEIYKFFAIDNTISSILLNDILPENASKTRDGWFLVKTAGEKACKVKTVKINGNNLNMRLMGYLFSSDQSRTELSV